MTDKQSVPLGRRIDHILVDQSLMAWTHRVLGVIAGCVLVFSMTATSQLQVHRLTGWSLRAFGGRAAFMCFIGALPLLISYFENRNRVDDNVPKTTAFLVVITLIAVAVDGGVLWLESAHDDFWKVGALYAAQSAIYVCIGSLMLPGDSDSDVPST